MVAKNLPSGSKVDFALRNLIHVDDKEAATASGGKDAKTAYGVHTPGADPVSGLIEFALKENPEDSAASLGSHEVGHAIQHYLEHTDPTGFKVLERQFGKMTGHAPAPPSLRTSCRVRGLRRFRD